MSRYFSYLLITFLDGSTERVGGNHHRVADGVLTVWTESSYGDRTDRRSFPLLNIREYRWEDEPPW